MKSGISRSHKEVNFMVVQHNLTAMNSNRMLGLTSKAQAKSTEKLSSGYKINRAADDAAGLSISEKMRKQIRGLTQASANAQDGISAVQTAEGALTEVHDMLQRMNELAIKAGNGTMSESDRQSVQDEIDQLITEIDRVSETTKFNETYLLKGEGKGNKIDEVSARVDGKIQEAAITEARGNIFSGTLDMDAATKLDAGTEDTATVTYKDEEGNTRTKDVTFKTGTDAKTTAANLAEAINKDDTLKHIFKATSNGAGKLEVESKLDGTKTDSTKNAVTKIEFESARTASTGEVDGTAAVRMNKFDGAVTVKAAVGESYSFAVGAVKNDGTLDFKLKDGESITINGKTYTYDAGKDDNDANSFKDLADLEKLLGDEYQVNLQVTGKKTTTTYTRSDEDPATANNDGAPTAGTPVTEDIVADLKDKTKFSDAAMTDFDTTETFADVAAPAKNSDVGNRGDATPASVDAVKYADTALTLTITEKATTEKPSDVLNFSLQVGADTTEENKISVDIESMSAKSLGIDKVTVTGTDSTNADKAVNTIADAIAQVSKQRSALGAIQNRLEHTINNLDNVVENTTSAESAIRDTDMATEMVKYSNNNILAQAGQAMLAQANQSNQGVLSLLG